MVEPVVKTTSDFARRVEEPRDRAARGLVLLGREVGQEVQATVNIRIFVGVAAGHSIDHRLWLLRRGAVVEVDERPAVYLAGEDREVATDLFDIIHHGTSFVDRPSSDSSIATAKERKMAERIETPSTIATFLKP